MARFDIKEASSSRSRTPTIDYLTKKLAGVIASAQQTSSSFWKVSCRCGKTVPNKTFNYQGVTIGAGAIHLTAYHRSDVPHSDLLWLENLFLVAPKNPRPDDLG